MQALLETKAALPAIGSGDIVRWLLKGKFKLLRKQTGFTLIEILVGLALLSIIGVAFLNGLFTTSKIVAINQESVAVESLAKSQIELIKSQDYIRYDDYDPVTNCYDLISVPADLVGAGYSTEINPPVVIIPGEGGFELQSVTVVIKRNGEEVFTISTYRVESPE